MKINSFKKFEAVYLKMHNSEDCLLLPTGVSLGFALGLHPRSEHIRELVEELKSRISEAYPKEIIC